MKKLWVVLLALIVAWAVKSPAQEKTPLRLLEAIPIPNAARYQDHFGLDLESCVVNGSNDNLVAVSPKSGRAVSAAEAEPYAGKLLALPAFVRDGGTATWPEIAQGLDRTGHFLLRDVVTDRARPIAEARERLVERLRRAGGLA